MAVDPEMIGKVYESLVNVSDEIDERGEAGIFYTPRTEIDLMCRLALVDNLANHLGENKKELFYQLVFSLEPDEKADADKIIANNNLWPAISERLHKITVLDPACGSGSFLVGMLHILDDLQARANKQLGKIEDAYTRKKRIIGQSLYGVDVMEWACRTAELRLWLALIVDTEFSLAELHVRNEPLLPHFTFKIRCGDSLVQEIGGINLGHMRESFNITPVLNRRISQFKEEKNKFFNNDRSCKFPSPDVLLKEEKQLFLDILDKQTEDIQKQIDALRIKIQGAPERRIRLDGTIEERSHQMNLEAEKQRQDIDIFSQKLQQIKTSYQAVNTSKEKFFVWDIAFVEIFAGESQGFDIVIGNPPYVRQEAIADPKIARDEVTVENKKVYKEKLAQSVYQAYPHFFGYKPGSKTIAHKINGKSDLYIYFYFHGLSLLNNKGSFCFITSNSWLDVGYGADLQEFLLKHGHIKMVLDNQVKRTFANADVNSIIALLSTPDDTCPRGLEKTARFVMFRVPFEYILSPVIFDEIEESNEHRITSEYRVFPIKQKTLLEDGYEREINEKGGGNIGLLIKAGTYMGNKWGGKYLRAPDIYWKIINKLENSTVLFDDIIHKDYGIKPGCVEFFYINEEKKELFDIEECFLMPIVNSSRSIESIYFESNAQLFYCHKPKKELNQGTLNYIKWGENQGFNKLASTSSHRPFWYSVNGESVDFLLLQFWDKRFWTPIAKTTPIFCSNNFFYGRCLKQRDNLLIQMNSSWYFMQIELFGRANQGQGVLTTYGPDYEYIRFIDPLKFTAEQTSSGVTILDAISHRSILPIWEEFKLDDRKALDNIIFHVIGLTDDEIQEFYFELGKLVTKRIERASSLK